MGNLCICAACKAAAASSALARPSCSAALQAKGLNLVGQVGVLVCLGSCAGCVLVGPLAFLPMIVGILLAGFGRSNAPKLFALRRMTPADCERLGLPANSGALVTPAQGRLIAFGILALVAGVVILTH